MAHCSQISVLLPSCPKSEKAYDGQDFHLADQNYRCQQIEKNLAKEASDWYADAPAQLQKQAFPPGLFGDIVRVGNQKHEHWVIMGDRSTSPLTDGRHVATTFIGGMALESMKLDRD